MSVISKNQDNKRIFEIDNGDKEKLEQCMSKWKFKDHQSFMRFAMSILLVTEDQNLWIKSEGKIQQIVPAKAYLKDDEANG